MPITAFAFGALGPLMRLVTLPMVSPVLALAVSGSGGDGGGEGTGVDLAPSQSGLPGGHTLQTLINGLGWWSLMAALVGLLIGAAAWALGSHTQNYHQSFVGRKAVLISGLAALLIGGAPTLINFFFHTGVTLS